MQWGDVSARGQQPCFIDISVAVLINMMCFVHQTIMNVCGRTQAPVFAGRDSSPCCQNELRKQA